MKTLINLFVKNLLEYCQENCAESQEAGTSKIGLVERCNEENPLQTLNVKNSHCKKEKTGKMVYHHRYFHFINNLFYVLLCRGMLSEKEVDLGQEEDDEEEEEGDKKEDEEGPRSDLTNDYHPNRVSNYVPEQDDLWSVGGSQETLKNEWVVEDFNVTEALKDFQIASAKVTPKILSDMRLL